MFGVQFITLKGGGSSVDYWFKTGINPLVTDTMRVQWGCRRIEETPRPGMKRRLDKEPRKNFNENAVLSIIQYKNRVVHPSN